MYTWTEIKYAVNRIISKHNPKLKGVDYVKDICNNALPHAIIQVLAMEMAYDNKDKDTEIVIDGYHQLQKNAMIKNG
jgi:hypothetical protein